jgi:hypothetical protein
MIPKTIKYSQRLGDIIRCLPAFKYLADQGHEVFVDCLPQYHGIFEMVSYAKAGNKGDVIDLEIWPNKYQEYRFSNKTWTEFVYAHPDINKADPKDILFDKLDDAPAKGFPETYNMVAPFGISQIVRHDPMAVIKKAVEMYGKDYIVVLCPPELDINGLKAISCSSVAYMPFLIQRARNFLGINSSPSAIASAVRDSYDLIPTGNKQDDYTLGANIIRL